MRIYTLGTSHGATEKGRDCSGNLLKVNDWNYLFDCGGNVEGKMTDLELPIRNIRCIFISHMHEDHVGTLSAIVKRFIYYIHDDVKLKIYMPEQKGIDAFKNWLSAMHIGTDSEKLSFEVVRPGVIYTDDDVSVTAIETHHIENGKFPSFAYVVETKNKRFLYTGDLSGDFHDFPQVAFEKEFDTVLSELVHFNVDKNLQTLMHVKTKHLIFTHVDPKKAELMETLKEDFSFEVSVAKDCDFFDI